MKSPQYSHTRRPRTVRQLVSLAILLTGPMILNAWAGAPSTPHVVFLKGEPVTAPLPESLKEQATLWRVLDDQLATIAFGGIPAGQGEAPIDIGVLDVGWYRIDFLDQEQTLLGFTTRAVLAPLPQVDLSQSPIAVDAALSWLTDESPEDADRLIRLARLAGVGWIRDRLRWRDLETASGEFTQETRYDYLAQQQRAAGLRILQVFHDIPPWARPDEEENGGIDLRRLYHFCAAMARRFQGRVSAWEPWNEGNAANFGGRSIDALCSWQKAAYLGFKSVDPDLQIGWNPLGGINNETLCRGILENETWPYFDTYNLHAYDWPEDYARLWRPARQAASGRPILVTEADRGMGADPLSEKGDFTDRHDRRKAEFLIQAYVQSLYSGAHRHFHFILGPYMEGTKRIQFGLLRDDLSPRRSYVALATLGRLLADAQCLGRRLLPETPQLHAYAFRARPFAQRADVLVVWAEPKGDWEKRGQLELPWPFAAPLKIEAVYDYLGRPRSPALPQKLTAQPIFLICPPGALDSWPLQKIPLAPHRLGAASPLVLQWSLPTRPPTERMVNWAHEHYYRLAPGESLPAGCWIYNFGEGPLEKGRLSVTACAPGWRLELRQSTFPALAAQERCFCEAVLHAPDNPANEPAWFTIRAWADGAAPAALAFYALAEAPLP